MAEWEPITIPAASLKSLFYNIRASLDELPNGVSKAIGVGSLNVLEERLSDEALMRGYRAARKLKQMRVGDLHTHAAAFREALIEDEPHG